MASTKEKRQNGIVEYVKQTQTATCKELSDQFRVTEETIRKDLTELSERNLLIRTFGGASVSRENGEQSLDQRRIQNYAQKQRIAQAALQLIEPGDLIVLDAGSTTMVLAQLLPQNSNIIVVTNSLEITNILAGHQGITVICTGGRFHAKSRSFQGIQAENAIATYNIRKAFLSCAAVDVNRGVMDTSEGEVRIKNRMLEAAQEVYLLADSSKIGTIAHVTTCHIERIHTLLTDSGITSEQKAAFQSKGVRVIAAE